MEPGVQMVIYPEQNFTKNQKIAFLFTQVNQNMPEMKESTEEMKDLTACKFEVFLMFPLHFKCFLVIAF